MRFLGESTLDSSVQNHGLAAHSKDQSCTKEKSHQTATWQLTLQILSYEFLGPIKLSEWGPPMEQVIYILLNRTKDSFQMIYVGESEKSQDADFFKKHEKSKCWIDSAGSEANLYLSVYPMWDSTPDERKRLAGKIIHKYKPSCN
ncbi:hypothetical protein [Candidatus Nitrosotenuis chungbukensis]|uniref:hypothetical protein n=1 Tax=Candidatus Nitrosotenuis chungbukensis TaxID=1353246 RepID=UPI0012FEA5C8|nr:hypothetical protein [Candidatus Nitrosotenuis chungbukensis]